MSTHPMVDLKGNTKKEQAYELFEAGYTVLDEVCSLTGIKPSTVQVYYNKWLVDTGRREPRPVRKRFHYTASKQYEPVISDSSKVEGLEVVAKGVNAEYRIDKEGNMTITTPHGTLTIPNSDVYSILAELSQLKNII